MVALASRVGFSFRSPVLLHFGANMGQRLHGSSHPSPCPAHDIHSTHLSCARDILPLAGSRLSSYLEVSMFLSPVGAEAVNKAQEANTWFFVRDSPPAP